MEKFWLGVTIGVTLGYFAYLEGKVRRRWRGGRR